MEPSIETSEILTLLRENNDLLKANNAFLQKMEKRYVRGFWFKLVSFIVFFILPILLIPYFMNSYLSSLGISSGMGSMFGNQNDSSSTDNTQKLLDILRNNPSNPR